MKKELIIGIDVSKDKLDLCLLPVGSTTATELTVISNHPEKIAKYLNRIDKRYKKQHILVCLEHTGHYGLELCLVLQQMEFDYSMVPALEIKNSVGMTRGKTDQVDALRIATYGWRFIDKIRLTTLPTNALLLMKELLALRDQNVKTSVQLQNSLQSHKIASKLLKNDMVVDRIKNQFKGIKKEIHEIEQQLSDLINSDQSLKNNFSLLVSIKGVGPIIAMVLIVTTQNFSKITDGRKYNSYAGLAPFKHESGKMNKGARVSNLANKNVKRLLRNGASSAVSYDKELKAYYRRKQEEGKKNASILNAVACKLVYRVFAVIKRQTPFVNLYQNNFA